jgi:RNA polymerase sigma-70 factor (ECF subfamily)
MTASVELIRASILTLLPRLRRFARVITRHPADADDLVQLAIERALLRHAQWHQELRFESWMFGIVRNAWIDEVRARKRRAAVLAPEEEGSNVADSRAPEHIDLLAVQAAMHALPEEQRMAVALVLIEGLSYKEAATALEIPQGTLTSRLARAREALQAQLQ